MAANDELFRILLDVVGTEGIVEARKAFDDSVLAGKALADQYASGKVSQEEYLAGTKRLADQAAKLEQTVRGLTAAQADEAEASKQAAGDAMRARIDGYARAERAAEQAAEAEKRAAREVADAEKQAAGEAMRARIDAMARAERSTQGWADSMTRLQARTNRGFGDATQKVQQFGYALDDLQYVGEQGLRPILNNLMQISPIVGIAALAVDQIVQRAFGGWGKLWEKFGAQGATAVDQLKAKIEELEKKKIKLPIDQSELDEAKGKLEAIEKLQAIVKAQGEASKAEAARATAVTEAVVESGRGATAEALKETGYAPVAKDPAVQAARKRFDRATARKHEDQTVVTEAGVDPMLTKIAVKAAEDEFRDAKANLRAAVDQAMQAALAQAATNQGDLDSLVSHMQAHPDAFKETLKKFEDAQQAAGAARYRAAMARNPPPKLTDVPGTSAAQRQFVPPEQMADAVAKAREADAKVAARLKAEAFRDSAAEGNPLEGWAADSDLSPAERDEERGRTNDRRRNAAWRAAASPRDTDSFRAVADERRREAEGRRRAAANASPPDAARRKNAAWRATPAEPAGPPIKVGALENAQAAAIELGRIAGAFAAHGSAADAQLAANDKALWQQVASLRARLGQSEGQLRLMQPAVAGTTYPFPLQPFSSATTV